MVIRTAGIIELSECRPVTAQTFPSNLHHRSAPVGPHQHDDAKPELKTRETAGFIADFFCEVIFSNGRLDFPTSIQLFIGTGELDLVTNLGSSHIKKAGGKPGAAAVLLSRRWT